MAPAAVTKHDTEPATDLPGSLGIGYAAGREDQAPLGGYAAMASIFAAGLPDGVPLSDLVLIGIATHKASRLITKDRVTAFVRAPSTRYQRATGHGEVEEAPRGRGMRKSVGELLVCPYCVAQWVAGGFVVGYVHAPRATRLLAGMWTAHAIADFVQLAYSAAEKRA